MNITFESFPENSVINNKYLKWYLSICSHHTSQDTLEKHHIIPKSFGGNNSKDNVVRLTPREHFIVHRLLIRCTKDLFKRKAAFAAHFMISGCKNHSRGGLCSSRVYEGLRQQISLAMKGYNPSPEARAKLSKAHKGKVISEEQKALLSAALIQKKAFFAWAPDNTFYQGDDLRPFCKEQNVSIHTINNFKQNEPVIILAGKRKGWVISAENMSVEEVKKLRNAVIAKSRKSRSQSAEAGHEKRTDYKVSRTAVSLLDPAGELKTFKTLYEAGVIGPGSTLQNVKNKLPWKFVNGPWTGWTLLSYETTLSKSSLQDPRIMV